MKILLLTDMPPCDNFTAGIVIKHLYNFLIENGHSVACFGIIDSSLNPDIPKDILAEMPYLRCDKPRESWGVTKYGSMASVVFNNYAALSKLPNIAKQAAEFAKLQDAQMIWSVVQGQTMIKITRKIASLTGLPYVVEVWDPPEWWLSENKFDAFTFNSVMDEFGQLLKHSRTCLAASWAMAEEYHRLYGANCIPVIPSLDDNIQVMPAKIEYSEDEFIIGFAGQLYARDEFYVLLQALNKLGWKHGGKRIKLVLYGAYFNLNFNFPANVLLKGWVQQERVLSELSMASLLYCPYWFNDKFQRVARLSFPSKLTSYLKTKTPVLIHGPAYASSSIFVKENAAGYVCNSQDSDELSQLICNIIDDPERVNIGIKGYEVYKKHLTFETMRANFFKALGI